MWGIANGWLRFLPPLRYLLACDSELLAKALACFIEAIARWQRLEAKRRYGLASICDALTAAVTLHPEVWISAESRRRAERPRGAPAVAGAGSSVEGGGTSGTWAAAGAPSNPQAVKWCLVQASRDI